MVLLCVRVPPHSFWPKLKQKISNIHQRWRQDGKPQATFLLRRLVIAETYLHGNSSFLYKYGLWRLWWCFGARSIKNQNKGRYPNAPPISKSGASLIIKGEPPRNFFLLPASIPLFPFLRRRKTKTKKKGREEQVGTNPRRCQ